MEKEEKTAKTKFYRIKAQAPVEQKGQILNRNPRFAGEENGEVGDVLELTSDRAKQLGEHYFQELTEKEHKEWTESRGTKKFFDPPPATKK